jgi:putative hydrolase of the HAD superfamily
LIKGLVLDLDDTLYLERDYVRSGFSQIASHLDGYGVVAATEVFDFLWSGFENGERGRAFDALFRRWPGLADHETVQSLVERYRGHSPAIALLEPAAVEGLGDRTGLRLGLISDGWPASQVKKLTALGITDVFDSTVLTGIWGTAYSKPNHLAFATMERELGLNAASLAYLADNPHKDFVAPNERGWLSLRLRMPGQLHAKEEAAEPRFAPEHEVSGLMDVLHLLQGI